MKHRCIEPNIDEVIAIETLRILSLSCISEHSSVPPRLLQLLNIDTELFGTPLNTSLDRFCSPFIDIEAAFGSLGSFATFKMTEGKYVFNPPYDTRLMNKACKHLIQQISIVKAPIYVLCILPCWDSAGQKALGLKTWGETELFEADTLPTILCSGFVKSHDVFSKAALPYYNYFTNQYIPISPTNMIVLSN